MIDNNKDKAIGERMSNLTKDNPARSERDFTIAQKRLEGATYKELAEAFGISKTRIAQILNDEEIKEILKEGSKELVALIPKAVDNYRRFLDSENDNIRLKSSNDVMKMTGYTPHTHPIHIEQFNQTNEIVSMSPETIEFLKWKKYGRGKEETIESEEKD